LKQLPNEKEIPEILKNISTLGKESQLEFALFRPKPEEPQQFYAKVPIELTMGGTYHNTGTFFDRVSKLSRIINVVDFNMTRVKDIKGKSETEILVKTSCMINTYRFIEKKSEETKSEKKTPERADEGFQNPVNSFQCRLSLFGLGVGGGTPLSPSRKVSCSRAKRRQLKKEKKGTGKENVYL
jgi:hypothetical protein